MNIGARGIPEPAKALRVECPMYSIDIADLQACLTIDRERVEEIVIRTLQAEGVTAAQLAVALVDDLQIHEVNREHLGHDYPTDVISFLYESTAGDGTAGCPRGFGKQLDGELVVSTETAVRLADSQGWGAVEELTLYLVHGLLHLCGYDDLTDEERVIMRQREIDILQIWNLLPHYSE